MFDRLATATFRATETLRGGKAAPHPPPLEGKARIGRRTKELVKTLRPGEVAVIRHTDLDSVAARSLIERSPAFVVNASDSISGRYPNSGPTRLLEAGIPLLDRVGDAAFEALRDGDTVTLDGARLLRHGEILAEGRRLTPDLLTERISEGKRNIGHELRGFAENTLRRLVEEAETVFEPMALPALRTDMLYRDVVVVARGEGFKDDLMRVFPYIQERRPVLIGVDGGADALLEMGIKPHLIFGDMDSVSDKALRCGAELVVHAYADGRSPGMKPVERLGLSAAVFAVAGTSEDAAMLMAYECGAEMIVAVGTHFTLLDFLDKGRAGMSSTFLTRLRVGSILVDAKGVSRLHRPGVRGKEILALVVVGIFPLLMVIMLSPKLSGWVQIVGLRLRLLWGLH